VVLTALFSRVPPRPWRVVPAIPGSPAFIRAADGKTVVSGVRSEEVADAIVAAVNAYEEEATH
jgi:hypothetical protein